MSKSEPKASAYDVAGWDLSPPFNIYTGRDTREFAITEFDESKTSQEHAEEADINTLMARYVRSGVIPQHVDKQPFYVDAADLPSFMEMQNVIIEADKAFASLPSAVRERFNNDPAKFVEFASDEANVEELRRLDLLSPEAVERLDKAAAARLAASQPRPPQEAAKPPEAPKGE